MTDKVFLDEDNMSLSIDKISMYNREEELSLDNLKSILVSLNDLYKTNNTSLLNNKYSEIDNKTKVFKNIHSNNIYVLNKKIEQHRNLKMQNIMGLSNTNIDDIKVMK